MSELNLPVLDLSQLDEGPDAAASFRAQLRAATHDVGFFYLTGTGVTPELEARLHRTARAFFELPEADKLAIENINSPQFRGYTRIGGERTQGEVDWREQIDIGPERGVVTDADAPDFARLIGPNLWPDAQPELREVATEWQEHLAGVARKLLRAWALALGAPETYFDEHFGEPATLLKIVRYPGSREPEPQQGVGAHKDSGVLTLLWVEPGKGGLQVERDGEWVDARRCPARSSSTSARCSSTPRAATSPQRTTASCRRGSRTTASPFRTSSIPPSTRGCLSSTFPPTSPPTRGSDAGSVESDPLPLRRERSQVAPARPPGRRRALARRPRGRSRIDRALDEGRPHRGRPSQECFARLNAGALLIDGDRGAR
jgi:isopenicillin N synthase-like dioxygenase